MLRTLITAALVIGIGVAVVPAVDTAPMTPLAKGCKEGQHKKHHKCEGHAKSKKDDQGPDDDAPPPAQA